MEVGIISFTPGGSRLCRSLAGLLESADIRCAGYVPARYLTPGMEAEGIRPSPPGGAVSWAGEMFRSGTSMVFIGAAGIAVRAIAPWVKDKLLDPAVVVMDEGGMFVVPILSGHVGGANELARRIHAVSGAVPVITTATDVNRCFAVDVFAAANGLAITDREAARHVAMDLLEGKQVGFFSDFPVETEGGIVDSWLPPGCAPVLCGRNIHVGIRPLEDIREREAAGTPEVLELAARAAVLGVGCRRGVEESVLEACVLKALETCRIRREAVVCLASIDVKRDEPAILKLAEKYGWELRFFSAAELEQVEGDFESSDFVKRTVGVGNVCGRAAVAASGGGTLVLPRRAGQGVTAAVAVRRVRLRG